MGECESVELYTLSKIPYNNSTAIGYMMAASEPFTTKEEISQNTREHILVVDHVNHLRKELDVLSSGQDTIKEAITKLTENMAFLQRLEGRVTAIEGRMNKIIGGLILSSVMTPVLVSVIVTVALYYIGKGG